PKTVRRRTASSVCPRPPHPEERACGSAAANQVVRARVSKDGAAIPLMLRDASQRSRAVDAFELAWAAMLLSMRGKRGSAEPTYGCGKRAPARFHCFGIVIYNEPQLQRVEPLARAPPRIVRRCCVARGSMSWRGVGGRETQATSTSRWPAHRREAIMRGSRSCDRLRPCNQGRTMCIRSRMISARVPAFGVLLALLASTGTAPAQNFPSRPLTLVVPFAAGGPSDVAVPILAQAPRDLLGQQA